MGDPAAPAAQLPYPPPSVQLPNCSTCRYWKRIKPISKGIGQCRRYPPIVTFCTNGDYPDETQWPITTMDEWCGDHCAEGKCK